MDWLAIHETTFRKHSIADPGNRCELGLDLLKIKIKGRKALGTIVHSDLGRITVCE
jgi:hypothetical protein